MPEFQNLNLEIFSQWEKIAVVCSEVFIYFYLSDSSLSIGLQDKDLCPRANVEIPSLLEICLSSSQFRATLLTSIV